MSSRARRSPLTASQPTAIPASAPMPSSIANRPSMSAAPKSGSWIHSMKPITSSTATGSLKPASPSSVWASRRRSVEPRRIAKIAAPSVEAMIEPSSRPSTSVEVEQPRRRHAGDRRRDEGAHQRQAKRRAQHRPDLVEARREAALEQDQRERDDADRARELVVALRAAELDPAQAVRADHHAERRGRAAGRAGAPARQAGTPRCRQRAAAPATRISSPSLIRGRGWQGLHARARRLRVT